MTYQRPIRTSGDDSRRRCVLETSSWWRLRYWLRGFQGIEKGGVGIGFRSERETQLLAYLWPRQLHRSPTFCEFETSDLSPLIVMLHDLAAEYCPETPLVICSWVHTHPGLGIFLSGTDKSTVHDLAYLTPSLVAVVFDVFARGDVEFKAFDIECQEIASKTADLTMPASVYELLQELGRRLPSRMEELGRPIEALFTPVSSYVAPDPVEVEPPVVVESGARNDPDTGHASRPNDDKDSIDDGGPTAGWPFSTSCWLNLTGFLERAEPGEYLVYAVVDHGAAVVEDALLVRVDMLNRLDQTMITQLVSRLLAKVQREQRYRLAWTQAPLVFAIGETQEGREVGADAVLASNPALAPFRPAVLGDDEFVADMQSRNTELEDLVRRLDCDHGIWSVLV